MTAIGTSCIIHSEMPCQEQFPSTENAMIVDSRAANRLTEGHRGGGEADWGRQERNGQESQVLQCQSGHLV